MIEKNIFTHIPLGAHTYVYTLIDKMQQKKCNPMYIKIVVKRFIKRVNKSWKILNLSDNILNIWVMIACKQYLVIII